MNTLTKSFILAFLFIIPFSAIAQNEDMDQRELFKDAEYFLLSEDYKQALSSFLRIYTDNPENANINYRIGMCYLNIQGKKDKAIPYLQYASKHISKNYSEGSYKEKNAPFHCLFLLGSAYLINNEFDRAKKNFIKYKEYLKVKDVYAIDYVNKQIKSCEFAQKSIKEPLNIKTRVYEEVIPQLRPNYKAVRSANDEVLVYLTEEKFYNAMWMVKKDRKGKWMEPVNITPQVVSDGDCYPTSLSADGKTLYMVCMNNFGADIFVSEFVDGKWSVKEKLDKPVNSRFWETHASISQNGRTLYFTSNRKGGFGGMDIYKSEKKRNGEWGSAVNLGKTINTPYSEETPFITENGSSLYFSSQGHQGMGGYDVYKTELLSKGKWSVPINLSYPLNTTDDNLFLFPLEDENKFMYSGILLEDDMAFAIKEVYIAPESEVNLITLNGSLDTEDNDLMSENTFVILRNTKTNSMDTLEINFQTKSFRTEVEPGKYELITTSDGYAINEQPLSIPSDYHRSELALKVSLKPEEVASGEYFVIKSLLFDFDQYKLTRDAMLEIERLYMIMKNYPELYIEVTGHTDAKGSPLYNLKLSQKRANEVVNYLVEKGIDRLRFVSKGVGEMQNLALNVHPDGSDNPEGRKLNRNVRIKILRNPSQNITIEPAPIPDYLKPQKASYYTLLLTTSRKELPDEYFSALNRVTQEKVTKIFKNSSYIYSTGRFFSLKQAKEVLSTPPFRKFPGAKVVESQNLESYSSSDPLTSYSQGNNYSIQIFALRNSVSEEQFNNLGKVDIIKCNDGLYRVFTGSYKDYSSARTALREIHKKGYADGFIVNMDKFKAQSKNTGTVKKKSINPDNQKSVYKTINKYTIQLKRLKTRVAPNYFHPLKDIMEIEEDNQSFSYIYGEYNSREEAVITLEKIKKLGYKDAYIRKLGTIPGI